jgi:hypothetical protein
MTELETLKQQAAELLVRIEQLEQLKWEPKWGEYFIDPDGEIKKAVSTPNCRQFGTERDQKKAAERAYRTTMIALKKEFGEIP